MSSWVQRLAEKINGVFEKATMPIQKIPPILLLCEIKSRSGLSAMALTSNIISRQEVTDDMNPCGIPNINNRFWRIVAEETVKHIKEYGVAKCVIDNGAIQFECIIGETTVPGSNTTLIPMDGITA